MNGFDAVVSRLTEPDRLWSRSERPVRHRFRPNQGSCRVLGFSADEGFWQCKAVLEAIYWSLGQTPPRPLRGGTSPPSGAET